MKLTRYLQGAAVTVVTAVASTAHAAIDTAAVTTAVADAGTAGGVIGVAVLAMFAGIKAFKWVRGAM